MINNPVVRAIVATVSGLLVAVFVIAAVESAGHMIFPPPEGLDLTKPADQARLMSVIPFGAQLAVVIAWFLGAFAGASVATYLGRSVIPGWIVVGFLVLASIWTTQMFPHPMWMIVAAGVLPVSAKLLADKLLAARLNP
ncbi:hypothetical protein [Parerythrobacter jejuensis]|uniref:Uncharacterized protein n=1 Tax=Parerythrobacter jejuensis TaxID=795812 RepID=A0A845AUP6_9SPHN|nr:hypothetical protein [Parerythrobacter jejuensis]MXP32531.1 hypothetical protein [Parerythrobacter jejuensis]